MTFKKKNTKGPLPREEKNINFFDILVWIPTKHDMGMTNINFIFEKLSSRERKVSERGKTCED